MAKRPAWTIRNDKIVHDDFEFEWNGGFAVSQKQKNIKNLHNAIKRITEEEALEISSKGLIQRGKDIGAFSLKLNSAYLENVFQSSKKYEQGGPFLDLLEVLPKEAKRDERHKNSGKLVGFEKNGEIWPLEPKTLFYDYIYVTAMVENYGYDYDLSDYDWFTDIEFNPNKSINCQARSAVIYKLLQIKNMFQVLESREKWILFHNEFVMG